MGSISEGAGVVIGYIEQFFNDMGGTCADLLSSGLKLYKDILVAAVDMLSKDYQGTVGTNTYTHVTEHYGQFSDFWTVIDKVSGIFAAIATTLITLLFLISLVNDSWDNRHDLDFSSLFKSFAKFFAAVVLVNNATNVVGAIFSISSKLAAIICNQNNLTDMNIGLKAADDNIIRYGISGAKGIIVSILFLMVFLVIVASGITVMLEVYQRMFKIFILIPFSAISFSTFTMSDSHRGAEVFHGYVKSIISTAIESIIIVVFIAFSLTLIGGETMDKLFESENGLQYETYHASSQSDILYLKYCKNAKEFSDDQVGVISKCEINEDAEWANVKTSSVTKAAVGTAITVLGAGHPFGFVKQLIGTSIAADAVEDYEEEEMSRSYLDQREALASDGAVSESLLNELSTHHTNYNNARNTLSSLSSEERTSEKIEDCYKEKGVVRDNKVSAVVINGIEIDELDINDISVSEESPVDVYVYGQIGFFDILICLFKYVFPCLLCGSAVKMAGQIAGMIVGR